MRYRAELPAAEARGLAGLAPSSLPGCITCEGGTVSMDEMAFASLRSRGMLGEEDWAITYEGDLPVLHAGGAAYEMREV